MTHLYPNKDIETCSAARFQQAVGLVSRVNGTGLRLEGIDRWFNISRYALDENIDQYEVGDRVKISFDRLGFVRQLRRLAENEDYSAKESQEVDFVDDPQIDDFSEKENEFLRNLSVGGRNLFNRRQRLWRPLKDSFEQKQIRLNRLSILNTAAVIEGSKGGVIDVGKLLETAEALEEWVCGTKCSME